MEFARAPEKSPAVEHVEATDDAPAKGDAAVDAATRGQAMTGYEHLSVMETIKTFKLASSYVWLWPSVPLRTDIRLGPYHSWLHEATR